MPYTVYSMKQMISQQSMKRIAIIGTQGVPAAYGGFETLVENLIGDNCPDDIEYTVFCSRPESKTHPATYKGARLRYVSLSSHGVQSIPYDILSMLKALGGYDVVMVLGTSGCSFLPIFRLLNRKRLIINIDGLEHRRDKWGSAARALLRFSERMAVRYADVVVADNQGIVDYVEETYGKHPALIAYGGDHALRSVDDAQRRAVLDRYGVKEGEFAVSVCRIEPENNCHVVLEAFARPECDVPLVFIGNWDRSDYGRRLKERYSDVGNIHICDPEYDLDTLCALRSSARCYIHGHSAGGTNPSLVEAMFAGRPVIACDVVYNRATTCGEASYFHDAPSLLRQLECIDAVDGSRMLALAREHYTWKHIAGQYAALY